MKLGIGTYAFMWSIGFPGAERTGSMDAFALLAQARELGVSVVQFGPNMPLDLLPECDLVRLVQHANANGIVLEYGTRGIDPDHLRKHITLARRLASTLLRAVPEFEVGDVPPLSEIASQLRSVLPDLEKSKVRLAIENGNIPVAELARLIQDLNSPWIGITLDTANSLAIPEGTRQVVQALAPYVFSFHVKDFVVQRLWHRMGFVVEGRPAGEGQMDFQWIVEQLQQAGADPNAILELWPPQQPELQDTIALEHRWAAQSVQYLRKFLPN